MASGFTVATTFNARGNLGRELKSLRRDFGQLGQAASTVKRTAFGFAAGAAVAGTAAFAMGVNSLKDEFIDLDQAVTNAASKWGSEFDRGTQGFEDLMAAAKQVGLTTEHSSGQAANGLNYLAMAGFTAAESMQLLPGLSNLATAANLDFATSTDIASDSLGAFGLANGDAASKASGLKSILEQVAKTTNKTNTNITQWFEAVNDGAPTFTQAGQSMSTFNTAVGLLANNGIKGTKAGIALRGMMATLSKDSGRSAETLRRLNVSVKDNRGNFRDFADIIGDLDEALAGKGTRERTGYLEKIFGKLQMSQASILIGQGAARFRELRSEIEQSTDAEVELATKMRGSVQNSLKLIESAFLGKGIDVLRDLFGGTDPADVLTNFAETIQNFDTTELVNALRSVIETARETGEWISENRTLLEGLAKAFIAFKIGSFVADLARVASGFTGLAGGMSAAGTAASTATPLVGGLGKVLGTAVPLLQAFTAGYAAGELIWGAIENQQKKAVSKENASVKTTLGASKMTEDQARAELTKRMREWDKSAYNRRATGTDVDVMGPLSANRQTRIQQETIQALQRRVNHFENQRVNDVAFQNRDYSTSFFEGAHENMSQWAAAGAPQVSRSETVERKEVAIVEVPKGMELKERDPGVMP